MDSAPEITKGEAFEKIKVLKKRITSEKDLIDILNEINGLKMYINGTYFPIMLAEQDFPKDIRNKIKILQSDLILSTLNQFEETRSIIRELERLIHFKK